MTDTWPQIANGQALLANTPVSLAPGHGFDSYNVFWPGLTIFSAVLSVLTGVRPLALMPVAVPLVNALAFLLLYALLRRYGLCPRHAFAASLLAGLGLATVILGAGATKETFALPLLFSFILLLSMGLESGRVSTLGLALVTFASLLLAHHITSLVALFVASYMIAHSLLSGRAGGYRVSLASAGLVAAMIILTAYYFFVHASSVVLLALSDSTVISFFAYQLAFLLPLLMGIAVMRSRRLVGTWSALALLSVLIVALGASRVSVTADAPMLSPSLLLSVAPYIVLVVLGAYAVLRLKLDEWRGSMGFFAFWALGILGVAYFLAFGTAGIIIVTLRVADYAFPAIAVLGTGALLYWNRGRGATVAAYAVVALLALASIGALVQTTYYQGPLGGNQHVYRPGDISVASWVGHDLSPKVDLLGDLRFQYLLSMSPGVTVNDVGGYDLLTQRTPAPSGCLVLSSLVSSIGYVFYDYGTPVPHSDLTALANHSSIGTVFDSGQDAVYCTAT
jgi:hypothetical protein